jgi:nucleoside-diphosphate-sugar epimerase
VRVFVAGASGVIGPPLVSRLKEGGHEVVAMTRTPEKAQTLRERGCEPVVCDALDAEGVAEAIAAARPDALIHHLTDIPQEINPRRAGRDFAANDRIRTEGTANLVAGAKAAGVRRVVAQSVAFFYAPGDPPVKSEDDPLFVEAAPPFDRSVEALLSLEGAVRETEGIDGVVLRFGFWYGPGTTYARDGSTARQVAKRRFPLVGDGGGMFSFIHVDDVAAATVAALEAPPGTYNVTDDDPAPVRDWLPAYAEALGAPAPRRVPRWLARLVAGPYAVYLMTGLSGASNEKAKRDLNWTPQHPTWRDGFREALG